MLIARLLTCFCAVVLLNQCTNPERAFEESTSPPKSPREELQTFQLDPAFRIQLVASEPLVQDPVFITFDEDGRLWVLEMRGFMPDIDGAGENQPTGRISILEDLDGDGEMDKSTIYLDSLVLPRALGLIKGGALVAENNSLWLTQDLNGDLRADTKILFDSTYSQNGIPEHSDNGIVRNIDNWYYSAKSKIRYRFEKGEWIRDLTEARGQWGLSHDDQGRLYYNYNWSQLHADLVPPNYFSRNTHHSPTTGIDHGLTLDRRIYPIRPNRAVNRGYIPGSLDEKGKLLEFTAACSPVVIRTTLFPKSFYGNVLVCEPAGNLIKRNVVKASGNYLEAHDPHPGREFLASTDERFRPVHQTIGPDGALYIADMYRGLIQHGSYVTPYLREMTLQRDLVFPIHMGRIWRIVPKKGKPDAIPKLSQAGTADLVQRLTHSNGWHRDMAQRLLVEREDPASVPLLEKLIKETKSDLARYHALWTLEGMGKLKGEVLLELLQEKSILIHNTALRMLEKKVPFSPSLATKTASAMQSVLTNADPAKALQIALSAHMLPEEECVTMLSVIAKRFGDDALIRDGIMSSLQNREGHFLQKIWQETEFQTETPKNAILLELLTSAILKQKDGNELTRLLALVDSGDPENGWKERTVLTGLAIQAPQAYASGTVAVGSEPALFRRTNLPISRDRLALVQNLFVWPGYTPKTIDTNTALLDQKALVQFGQGRQQYLVSCAGCHGMDGAGVRRMGPPLTNSEWVLGDETRLALIILHGMEGQVEVGGKVYDAPEILPVMPAHSTMDDGAIAAILTYIRNEWGNQAPPVTGRTVGTTRHTNQGRVYPWSASELNKHIEMLTIK
jgi:mono/diheme cytochrome c family protein/glucose/arabinose dehydrogenase